jgi:hypothetical protein
VSTTWSGPGHEHNHSILTALPARTGEAVMSWTDYRECACGHRVPAAVTEVSIPRIGDGGIHRLRSHMLQPEPEPEA